MKECTSCHECMNSMNAIYIFSYVTLNSLKPFHLYGLQICKVIRTKGRFYKEKGSSPTVMVREINNAAFLLLCDTNMAEMTPCKNALFKAQEEFNRDSWVKSIAGRAFLRIPF